MSLIDDLACISVKIVAGKKIGTGTIMCDATNYYVLTAAHCVTRDGDMEFCQLEEISIFSYATGKEQPISVLKILENSCLADNKDFAVLIIQNPEISFDFFRRVRCCFSTIELESFFFYGYSGHFSNEYGARYFELQMVGCNRFHFTGDLINNQYQRPLTLVEGCSGAGVFFHRHNVYYYVGYVKKLLDEYAVYDDLIVHGAKLFDELLPNSMKEQDMLAVVAEWCKKDKIEISEDLVKTYKAQNVSFVQNLKRKMDTIFANEEEAVAKVDFHLKNYLANLDLMHELQKETESYKVLKKNENDSFQDFKGFRSEYFQTRSEAIADLKDAFKLFSKSGRSVLGDESISRKYASFVIAEKLMNCSLDYRVD